MATVNNCKQRFVKPGEGRLPRHPVTGARYRRDGEWVEYIPEIARQLRDGDLVEVEPPKAETPATPRRGKSTKGGAKA